MTAAAPETGRRRDHDADGYDRLSFVAAGAALGCFAFVASAFVDGAFLAAVRYFSNSGYSDTEWPPWAVFATGLLAIVVSLVVGRWLYGLRRWIGLKGDPADSETIERKRHFFVVGAMGAYLVLTPFVWIMMVAVASTS